jgi:uncharacterized radical SAM superfamily Fe-S cluster-containing enzyme
MPLVVIGEAIRIISNRESGSDVSYMKENFSQIKEMLKKMKKAIKVREQNGGEPTVPRKLSAEINSFEINLEHDKIKAKIKALRK